MYKIVNDYLKSKPYSGTFEARAKKKKKKKSSKTRWFLKLLWVMIRLSNLEQTVEETQGIKK